MTISIPAPPPSASGILDVLTHCWRGATRSLASAASAAVLLALSLAATPLVAAGQDPGSEQQSEQESEQASEPGPTPPPSIFQVPARAGAVVDSAGRAEQVIQRASTLAGLEIETEESESRIAELQALTGSMVDLDVVRLERLSRLRDQALLEDGRLESIRGRIGARLDAVDEVRGRWLDRRETWIAWEEALRNEPGFAAVEPDVRQVFERIDAILATISSAGSDLLALQRRVEALRVEVAQVGDMVAEIRVRRRGALLQRTQPVLLSGGHRAELAEAGWRAWNPTSAIEPVAYAVFVRDHLGLLAFHILLALLVGELMRRLRLRPGIAAEERWKGLLERPFTLGVFASAVVAMVRITLAPPLWDVLLWVLFGVTAARLAHRLFADRALRIAVYLLAAFYPVFLFLEVAQLPEAVLRLGIVAVAALAIPLFIGLAKERSESDGRSTRASFGTWALRIGAAVLTAVLLAVTLGFDALGRWMLHAAVMSAAVTFVIVVAFTLVNAAAGTLERSAGGNFWRRAGSLLVQRAIVLFRIALIVASALVLLDVWGIAESPLAIWRRITDFGFTAGEVRITVGGLLAGALVIYVAVLLSGLVRSLLVPDLDEPGRPGFPRVSERGDQGVGQSISKLVHYVLITLGVVLAFGAVGVELQNFAIVAGALGIGIGFGLQNVVNNFASGLILLMERPVRVGDTVVVGDVWGTIQKIGLRSTIMLTLEQSEMIVPNGDLVSEKVINWTLTSPIARIIMPVGVAYGSPIADVLRILEEAATAHPSVLKGPPPEALFIAFGDSSLDFELRVWVQNIRLRLEVRSRVLAEIDRRFREAGIEIPFPQRDLHLRSVDASALARLGGSTGE